MFHTLKELYRFRSKSEPRLDRHRYWLAIYLLLILQVGGAAIRSQVSSTWELGSGNYDSVLIWFHYLWPAFSLDLFLIVLHIIVGISAFGRIMGGVAGIGTYSLGALISLASMANVFDVDVLFGLSMLPMLGLALMGIVALLMGFQLRSLRDDDPTHALLRLRADIPVENQLDCFTFLRRYLLANLVIGLTGAAIAGLTVWRLNSLDSLSYSAYAEATDSALTLAGFCLVILGIIGIIWLLKLTAQRLNACTDATASILCWGIGLTVIVGGGMAWLVQNRFYNSGWLLLFSQTIYLSLLTVGLVTQIYLVTKPSKEAANPEATEPKQLEAPTAPQDHS